MRSALVILAAAMLAGCTPIIREQKLPAGATLVRFCVLGKIIRDKDGAYWLTDDLDGAANPFMKIAPGAKFSEVCRD